MPRRDVQDEIISAAERIALEHGFAGVTTKEVARVAGCSQGSIYNHFRDRTDLLAQMAASRVLFVAQTITEAQLAPQAGGGAPLRDIVHSVSAAYVQVIALSTSLVADPDVRTRFTQVLAERGASAEVISDAATALIARGQVDGVIRTDVDAEMIALLITGTCHQAALHAHLEGQRSGLLPSDEERLTQTLETLLRQP